MQINREEFKRLSHEAKRKKVLEELLSGKKVSQVKDELGASNNLINRIKKEIIKNKLTKENRDNKILEVNEATQNLVLIKDLGDKAKKINATLERIEKTEEEIREEQNKLINSVLTKKFKLTEIALDKAMKNLEQDDITIDLEKVLIEVIKSTNA